MTDAKVKRLIAGNLRIYRGDLSLSEVARRSSSYPTTIKEIEDGNRMPGVGLLSRIAVALDVPVENFLKTAT